MYTLSYNTLISARLVMLTADRQLVDACRTPAATGVLESIHWNTRIRIAFVLSPVVHVILNWIPAGLIRAPWNSPRMPSPRVRLLSRFTIVPPDPTVPELPVSVTLYSVSGPGRDGRYVSALRTAGLAWGSVLVVLRFVVCVLAYLGLL